ncbi:GNAT family N-acetyltransferase [Lacticaseibacillus yichunensis]|uniref:GNAT family N-acetyltransferase n=1 Tax=Lacticaseibacillus yichunensis TaxID=2486015 RepID=A0ABW4CL27_9LACO|nr:GNAT family N-acetyltransferase [Lacticaseibacillus yichunensis]
MAEIEYDAMGAHEAEAKAYFIEHWGSDSLIISAGDYHFDDLNGLVALEDGQVVGLLTYAVHGNAMAVVSLNSIRNGRGIGKELLALAEDMARGLGETKMMVSIMNDNMQALGFFQRQGYRMAKILRGSLDMARQRKPEIPLVGMDDIPLHDEVLLSKVLPQDVPLDIPPVPVTPESDD